MITFIRSRSAPGCLPDIGIIGPEVDSADRLLIYQRHVMGELVL